MRSSACPVSICRLPEMKRILEKLGFFVAGTGKSVKVAVPSWRPDIEGKADIVEEVVRIAGVDRVPATEFPRGDAPRKPVLTTAQVRMRKAKRALAARGLVEAVTWSFISKPQAELFGGGAPALALANPIAADLLRHAAEPHSRPRHRRAEECRSRLSRCRIVRSRADFQRRPAAGSVDGRVRRAARIIQGRRRRASLAKRAPRAPTCSTPRPMRSRCSRPPARRCRRCRSCPADRPGFIPAAAARFRSARRTSWGISANCIRAHSRRSTPKARSRPSR